MNESSINGLFAIAVSIRTSSETGLVTEFSLRFMDRNFHPNLNVQLTAVRCIPLLSPKKQGN